MFAVGQGLAAALRIGVGRWSDLLGSRVRPLRVIGVAVAVTLAAVAVLAGLAGGARPGARGRDRDVDGVERALVHDRRRARRPPQQRAAIGFQQTVLSAIGVAAPIAFAAAVSGTSWGIAFGLAALFPLAGVVVARAAGG